jgi:hypothetical protein
MQGWIVNAADSRYDQEVDREQEPCFYLEDGTPIFEVWFWHAQLGIWFCMAAIEDPAAVAQGVVYFRPGDVDGLRGRMLSLESQAGIERC